MRKSIIESALAFVGAAALITVMAGPASATVTVGEVTGGTITSDITDPATVVELGGDDLCSDGDTTISVDVTGAPSPYDTVVTAASFPRGFFNIGSNVYRIALTLDTGGDNTGEITSGGAVNFQNLALNGTIHQVATEGQCTGGTLRCDLGDVEITSTGTHTFSAGSLPNLSGTATLDGVASFPNMGTCSAPFATLEDVGASVDDLTVVFPA